jgi:beta-glucanase (GH16 family)
MRKYKLIITLFVSVMYNNVVAQLPFGDSAWVLQPSLSDEFNASTLNTTKWNPNYWGGFQISNGAEVNYDTNLLFNSSTLKIRADTLIPNYYESDTNKLWYDYNSPGQGLTFAYQGGVIQSKTAGYKYGYIEYSAKFPSKKYSLWPALWLLGGDTNAYNELDIAENGAVSSFEGNKIGNYYHTSNITGVWANLWHGGWTNTVLSSGDSLSGSFHKFALQWTPEQVTWYFDDNKVGVLYDTTGDIIPHHNTSMLINFCIDPGYAALPNDWTGSGLTSNLPSSPTQWPQYFEIGYVRYYKLGVDCNTDEIICTSGDYDRKVKKSISTDTSCSPNYNPSTEAASYTLRATDYILISEGTTINPSGTGFFTAEITPCPQ